MALPSPAEHVAVMVYGEEARALDGVPVMFPVVLSSFSPLEPVPVPVSVWRVVGLMVYVGVVHVEPPRVAAPKVVPPASATACT